MGERVVLIGMRLGLEVLVIVGRRIIWKLIGRKLLRIMLLSIAKAIKMKPINMPSKTTPKNQPNNPLTTIQTHRKYHQTKEKLHHISINHPNLNPYSHPRNSTLHHHLPIMIIHIIHKI